MHEALIVLSSALASFIGSLQLGPVNLFVIDTTLNKNKTNAYWVAFGGIIPEFIYCTLAVYSGSYFISNPRIFIVFKIVLIITLTIIGFIYLLKKHKNLEIEQAKKTIEYSNTKHFFKGFLLAGLNPQLLPYWIFVMVYFNSIKFLELKSQFDKLAYIVGAGLGALILLIFIILTIKRFKKRILIYLNNKYYYKALGIVFIAISLQQLMTLL